MTAIKPHHGSLSNESTSQETTFARKDYYTILYQTAMAISSSIELGEVLNSIVEGVARAMGAKAAVLRLLDTDADQLFLSAEYGLGDFYPDKDPVRVNCSPIDNDTLRCSALQRSSMYIKDVRVDPRFHDQKAARRAGLVSALSVPLELHGDVLGLMRVYTGEVTTFSDDDVKFLAILASLAAQAIENARLYKRLQNTYSGVVDAFWGMPLSLA